MSKLDNNAGGCEQAEENEKSTCKRERDWEYFFLLFTVASIFDLIHFSMFATFEQAENS
jgi:hypothetical protein